MSRYKRRLFTDNLMQVVATGLAVIALALLAWILVTLFAKGFHSLSVNTFTQPMDAPAGSSGLANAIVGSLIMVALATVVAAPIGVMAGTYLSEIGGNTKLANSIRFINDVLLSAPSILIGLFVYNIAVKPFHGFSGIAGVMALGIVILPVVVRATEDMLRLVPGSLREAAFALGAPQWKVITDVMWRAARAGIVTGMLLALARAAGETAPLIFSSSGAQAWTFNLTKQMSNLPVTIYQYAQEPAQDKVDLAWAGALIITLGVLLLNISSRAVLAGTGRK
ncbi:MAG: phosphate ABC transporter permease PstA [Ancalomicrobiaceae bacterium]|nr:phosphate ABC transporter permease PstA [Ancalomicrobiaceae bacterium]